MLVFEAAQKPKRLIFNEQPLVPGKATEKLGKIEKQQIVDADVSINRKKWGFSVKFSV